MASPLFRWTIETAASRRLKVDLDETFFEPEEDEDIKSKAPLHSQSLFEKSLTRAVPNVHHKSISQSGFIPSTSTQAGEFPSNVSSFFNANFSAHNHSLDITSTTYHQSPTIDTNDFGDTQWQETDAIVKYSQPFKWSINDVSNNLSSSDSTLFNEGDFQANVQTHEEDFQVNIQSHEEDFQADIQTHEEDNSMQDTGTSTEMLTGLSDSQFNTYGIEPSSDDTFFDAGQNHTKVRKPQSFRGSGMSSNSIPIGESHRNGHAGEESQSSFVKHVDISQDVNFIPDQLLSEETVCNAVDFFEKIEVDDVEAIDTQTLSSPIEINDTSEELHVSPAAQRSCYNFKEVSESLPDTNMFKRRILPADPVEESKRRKIGTKQGKLRPIGKPAVSKIKKRIGKDTAMTPCHLMSLRNKKAKCFDKTLSPRQRKERRRRNDSSEEIIKSRVKKTPSRKKRHEMDPDYYCPNSVGFGGKEKKTSKFEGIKNTPSSYGHWRKLRDSPRSHSPEASFKNRKEERRSQKQENRQLKLRTPVLGSKGDKRTPVKNVQGKFSRVGEIATKTPGRKPSKEKTLQKNVVATPSQFSVNVSKDQMYLRNLRLHFLDLIFKDESLPKGKADGFLREIFEIQQRLRLELNRNTAEDVQFRGQLEELLLQCDTLIYQLKKLETNSSDASSGVSFSGLHSCASQDFHHTSTENTESFSFGEVQRENSPEKIEVVSEKSNSTRGARTPGNKRGTKKMPPEIRVNRKTSEKHRPETLRILKAEMISSSPIKSPACLQTFSRPLLSEDTPPKKCIEIFKDDDETIETKNHTEELEEELDKKVCSCKVLTRTQFLVDKGTNTDFVDLPTKKKIMFEDRGTNTDPADLIEKQKVTVDCGTNTEFDSRKQPPPVASVPIKITGSKTDKFKSPKVLSNQERCKVLKGSHKENLPKAVVPKFPPKFDIKRIKNVWDPRPSEWLQASSAVSEYLDNPSGNLPKELEDDLDWD